MKKSDVLIKTGIKLRSVTVEDRKQAKTTLQRNANFVITTANGEEYYSKNGSLRDCLWADANSKKKKKPKTMTKATPVKGKTATKRK